MKTGSIIIFDGVCNFCNGAINFIIKYDAEKKFTFTPMQTELAKSLMEKHEITNVGVDTFLLIKNNECYIWTNAAFEISKDLSGYWHLSNILKIIPRPVRDFFYRMFARNRYKLFGKQNVCMSPTADIEDRFVGLEKALPPKEAAQ